MANPYTNQQQDEEEEEDYMSEAFLNNLVSQAEKNTKKSGGGAPTYSERRRLKEKEHLANLPKPLHVREKEAREQGLNKELGEENKGMAMLLKMGFKKGGTLGAASGTGLSSLQEIPTSSPADQQPTMMTALRAPIEIQIKQGRGGLGMESSKKRQLEEEFQKQQQDANKVFDEGYRGKKGSQFDLEKRKRQLLAAQGICMRMDADRATSASRQSLPSSPGESELETSSTCYDKKGRRGSEWGRSNEFWWIADSVSDDILGTRAMGPGKDPWPSESSLDAEGSRPFDHSDDEDGDPEDKRIKKRIKLVSDTAILQELNEDEDVEPAKWGERPGFALLEVHEKMELVVAYLRREHLYCFWCAARYDGQEDLEKFCPGESEEDH